MYGIPGITLACNTAALMPRKVCSSLRSPVQQWKNMRTVSSRREKKNVPPVPSIFFFTVLSRRGRNYIPSRPVVKNYVHRPVPSSKKYVYRPVPSWPFFVYRPVPSWHFLLTVPSRRDSFCLPSRPVMKKKVIILYRPVPSRRENSHPPSRPVPSR